MIRILKNSFTESLLHHKSATILYVFSAFLTFILGYIFYQKLSILSQNNPSLDILGSQFELNYLGDFFRNSGSKLNKFILPSFISIFIFKLLEVFLGGGIIDHLHEEKFSILRLYTQSKKYFWSFFGLCLVYLLITLLILCVLILIINNNADLINHENEKQIFFKFLGIALPLLSLYFWISWGESLARIYLYKNKDLGLLNAYKQALKHILLKPKLWVLAIVTVIISYLFLFLYLQIESSFTTDNLFLVFLLFFIQQFYIWIKCIFKIWNLNNLRHINGNAAISSFKDWTLNH